MQQYSIHISNNDLTEILQNIFERLPNEYTKAINSFQSLRKRSFFRESLISNWIPIPTHSKTIFKEFDTTHRIINIFIKTKDNSQKEVQVYLNKHGIIGIKIPEDLDNLNIDSIDTSKYYIEKLEISKFYNGNADFEYLDTFTKIDDYLDNKYTFETYKIGETILYSIITLSDIKCVAIDENENVFLLNKFSGIHKLLFRNPKDFINAFISNKIDWLEKVY